MSDRKNYMRLFLAYCKKHEIWFAVCIDGSIDQCTYLADGHDETFEPNTNLKLGSKSCFDWIKRTIREIKENSDIKLRLIT